MKCESCGDRPYTYVDLEPRYCAYPDFDGADYGCEQCKRQISNNYCKGHVLYYESHCPYCEKLNYSNGD